MMSQKEIGILMAKLEALHEDIVELKGYMNAMRKKTEKLQNNQMRFKGALVVLGGLWAILAGWVAKHFVG